MPSKSVPLKNGNDRGEVVWSFLKSSCSITQNVFSLPGWGVNASRGAVGQDHPGSPEQTGDIEKDGESISVNVLEDLFRM